MHAQRLLGFLLSTLSAFPEIMAQTTPGDTPNNGQRVGAPTVDAVLGNGVKSFVEYGFDYTSHYLNSLILGDYVAPSTASVCDPVRLLEERNRGLVILLRTIGGQLRKIGVPDADASNQEPIVKFFEDLKKGVGMQSCVLQQGTVDPSGKTVCFNLACASN